MKYCKRCLEVDTRPNSKIHENGLCTACNYFDSSIEIDWNERFDILSNVVKKYKNKSDSFHDCIIGVSGGKDSTRQALWIRDKLGLNPLLVCLAYPPNQISERGAENLSNLIELGFDLHTVSLAPETWRKLMRAAFKKFTNWCKSTELALFSSVPQLAIRYEIELILWGENPALQLGDLKTLGKTGYDGNNLRYMNTLDGGGLDWMLEEGFLEGDLIGYKYPDVLDFEKAKLQIIYLGWFLGDWSLSKNAEYSCAYGLEIRKENPSLTGDLFGVSALDEDWVVMNQMIKYFKFGFGKTTDYVNEEIRFGKISRDEGIDLIERYDGKCAEFYIDSFCNYIDLSKNEFWDQIKKNLNKELFGINSKGKIFKKFKVGRGVI